MLDTLTSQQIACLSYIRQSIPPRQAVRMAGMDAAEGDRFLSEDNRGIEAVAFSRELRLTRVPITVELLTAQMYEERARAISATEGMACLNGIAKLNGLYDNKVKVKGEKDVGSDGQTALKQMYRKTDEELMSELEETTGHTIDLLPEKINRDSNNG